MKFVKFNQKLLLLIYLIAVVILGSLTADQDFIAVFEGNRIFLWYAMLTVFYGVFLLVTVWIVSYLSLLCYKIANKEAFDREKVTVKSVWLIIAALYAHVIVLYINHFLYSGVEILLLFAIPAVIFMITALRDMEIRGLKKFLVILPLMIYLVFDAVSVYYIL